MDHKLYQSVTTDPELDDRDGRLYARSNQYNEPITNSFTDPNWRRPKRDNLLPNSMFRARFAGNGRGFISAPNTSGVGWRNAKRAAKHLKYCPGEKCRTWAPLEYFGSNFNMADGTDIYCMSCNTSRRNEKRERTHSMQSMHNRLTLHEQSKGGTYSRTMDKFKLFEKQHNTEDNREREVIKRIDMAAVEAKGRFKRTLEVDSAHVSQLLFDRDTRNRYICNVTKLPLTRQCFLDHHSITFEVRESKAHKNKKVMDIICSDCKVVVS